MKTHTEFAGGAGAGAAADRPPSAADIPRQSQVSWGVAVSVAWGSLRRRILRVLVTMSGVVLAIAFLTYMLVTRDINRALVALKLDALDVLLQKAGVDIFTTGKTDHMMILLIGLSLLTCLVGIVNAMLMAVTERIKEIGTLKCLGATDAFIVRAYFLESSMQGILGTLLGLAFGLAMALAVAASYYPGYVGSNLPWASLLASMGKALLTGTLLSIGASILPAYGAACKQPVDAMRVEE